MIILGLLLTYTPIGRLVKSLSTKRLWSLLYLLLWLLGIQLTLLFAAIAYVALYQFYIPVNSLSLPLHFDFSAEDGAYAVAKLHGDVVSLNYVEPASNALWQFVPFVHTPDPPPEAPHNKVTTFGRPRDRIKALRFMNMPYSVYVNLNLPETDRNLGTGNFMIRVSFADDLEMFRSTHRLTRDNRKRWPLTHNEEYAVRPNVGSVKKLPRRSYNGENGSGETNKQETDQDLKDMLPALFTATRPAILAFQSAAMRLMDTLLFAPLYLTGWRKQEQHLHVYMASNWHVPVDIEDHEFAYAIVELDRTVDLYGAQIEWRVEWKGLRYFMYHYRVTAFILGTCVIWYLEVFYLAIAYYFGKRVYLKLSDSGTTAAGGTAATRARAAAGRAALRRNDEALDGDDPDTDTPQRSEVHTRSSEIQELLDDSETTIGGGNVSDYISNASQEDVTDYNEGVSLSASDSNVEGYQERESARVEISAGDSDDNSQTIRYPVSWPTPPPEGPMNLTRQEIEGINRYRYDRLTTPESARESSEFTDSLSESDEFDFETQLQIDLRSLVEREIEQRMQRHAASTSAIAVSAAITTGTATAERPLSQQSQTTETTQSAPRSPRSALSSRGSLRSRLLSTPSGSGSVGTATGSNVSSTISRQRHITPTTTPLPEDTNRDGDDGDDENE